MILGQLTNTVKIDTMEQLNDQAITNTWFYEHPICLWTAKSQEGDTKNQINDNKNINKIFTNVGLHPKLYPSLDCGDDTIESNLNSLI